MAFARGLYGVTLRDILDATGLAVLIGSDSFKASIHTNTYTPDFDTHDFFADLTNEITGTGYTAGGNVIDSITLAAASGVLTFDSADETWTTLTASAMRGAVYYDDTVVNDPLLIAQDFGGDFQVTAGNLTIQQPAAGIWTVDYTPV